MYLGDILSTLRHSKAGALLLFIQVAFSFAVLVNVYAMVDAYRSQVIDDTGFRDEDSLLGVTIRPYEEIAKTPANIGKSRNRIEQDMNIMRSIPGIQDVAMAHGGIPMQNDFRVNTFDQLRLEGEPATGGVPNTRYSAVKNTIDLLGLEIVAGRDFNDGDIRWVDAIATEGGPNIIVTQVMADALFPEDDPIGKQVVNQSNTVLTIIGIVRTAKAVYWAPYDEYASYTPGRVNFNEGYVVRLDRSAPGDDFTMAKAQIMQTLNEKLQAADVDRQVRVETMDELKKTNLGRYIIINAIVGGVAVLLVVVTALGNYGQMSYTVFKRTKQIGIRRALGATRAYIFKYFMAENFLISIIGMIPGTLLMMGLNFVIISSIGYGKFEWQHIAICSAFMLLVGFLSALLPVLRAANVSPAIATQTV